MNREVSAKYPAGKTFLGCKLRKGCHAADKVLPAADGCLVSWFAASSNTAHISNGARGYLRRPSSVQDHEAESSSEEHSRCRGHQRPVSGSLSGLSGGRRDGSMSSQDSRTESASLSQSQPATFFGKRTSGRAQQDAQHHTESQPGGSRAIEKRRSSSDSTRAKNKRPGVVEPVDYSDRGDSDMDEATYSGSQEQQPAKKAQWISYEYFPSV